MKHEVYRIDGDGVMLGVTVLDSSDIDPKTKEVLIPRGCIATPPPPEKDGYLRVWDGVTWGYSEWRQSDRMHRIEVQTRLNRENLLAKTDWTQLGDVPKATRDKWKPYRQALRDLPSQEGWPDNIVWPVAPA